MIIFINSINLGFFSIQKIDFTLKTFEIIIKLLLAQNQWKDGGLFGCLKTDRLAPLLLSRKCNNEQPRSSESGLGAEGARFHQ